MGQLVEVTLKIDAEMKQQAKKVLAENGLTLSKETRKVFTDYQKKLLEFLMLGY